MFVQKFLTRRRMKQKSSPRLLENGQNEIGRGGSFSTLEVPPFVCVYLFSLEVDSDPPLINQSLNGKV